MRQLATIKTINNIFPIPNRDKIELAVIDGWQVIVKKDEYQIGDPTVFCEIDSVLPEKPEFEFLRKNKFRIKTLKMAGVISQGICFPMTVLPENRIYQVDDDVTTLMGITKYCADDEIPVPTEKLIQKPRHFLIQWLLRFRIFRKVLLPKKEYRGFPHFISKTDEVRIQNIPHVLHNNNIEYIVREKIDGQSGTFFLQKIKPQWPWQKVRYEFGVCSRNVRLCDQDNSYWLIASKYNLEQALKELMGTNEWVAIQGECIGPKIQGNKYSVSSLDFYAFNLVTSNGKINCLHAEKMLERFEIKWAPLIDSSYKLPGNVNELLDFSNGNSVLTPVLREGIVVRNYDKGISFKVVSPEWLIKFD